MSRYYRSFLEESTIPSTLWNNLVAYYTGDNTPNDAKGTYNGTLINGATYGTGKINNGFNLDGVNDYVNIGDNLDIGLDSWSYNFWIKPTSLSDSGLITKTDIGNNWERWWIIMAGSKLEFCIQTLSDNTYRYVFTSSSSFSTGSWYMCSLIVNRLGAVKIFINGIEEIVTSKNAYGTTISNDMTPMASYNFDRTFNFLIGAYGGQYPFNGTIDEIAIWKNKLLTSTEVTELYNSGSGKQYIP